MDLAVFVIDDDEAARTSLIFLLRAEGLRCRSFASAEAFLSQLSPDHRGCIVTDVRMPQMDGVALVRHLKAAGSRMPVVMITGHADVPLAVEALKAGVHDFIEKPFESSQIVAAVRQCLELTRAQISRETKAEAVTRRLQSLTERERQVLEAIVDGASNKEAALALNISPRTVEIHRANVMSKMNASGLSELVRTMIPLKESA